ncbi:MAG TPA: glycosyltransferase [Thermoanaerobaculia bacterium]|nr:glycosyltransferase [Thermoanaerobaculia bacterium]
MSAVPRDLAPTGRSVQRPTRVCAISFKECWQDAAGRWYSNGGFPLQMTAIASLFDRMTLLVTRRDSPGPGALPLPENADVVPMRRPAGQDFPRKVDVATHLAGYLATIARHVRGADAVHVPPPGDLPLLGMLTGLAMGKRMIVRYCGSWHRTSRTTATNRVTRGLMRAFAGGRNVMLATGEAPAPPAPDVHWIFATGLSRDELSRRRPDLSRGLARPARLADIGRLSAEKGLDLLVEALAMLESEGLSPLPRIVLIGEGPERERLAARVAARGFGETVRFAGQLDRDALAGALADVDFCVHPSLTEGYSKAWLDAFSQGLPVLATVAGAAKAVIGERGERGWLVPAGDARALADALRRVLTEERDWPALRRRCREFAEARTLETWSSEIGRRCAAQWNVPFSGGKLIL